MTTVEYGWQIVRQMGKKHEVANMVSGRVVAVLAVVLDVLFSCGVW